jgi:two-component system chemotaxis response regulator CheY
MAKILVIDDDPGMCRTVSRILSRGGHAVTEASNGVKGMELVRDVHPDIVVTDIFMPQQEGFETIQYLRKEYPSTLILVISGGPAAPLGPIGRDRFLDMATGLGAHGILAKPFRAEDLVGEIDRLLQAHRPGT